MMSIQPLILDKAKAINGWMLDSELVWLANVAQKSKLIVEIGSYLGRSTRALADNTDGIVISIDPWIHTYFNDQDKQINCLVEDSYEQFKANLADHIDSGKVIMIRTLSSELPILDIDADFIFIDGDHRYGSVKHDIKLARHAIKLGGIIAGHDYIHLDWPGVKKAVDEIFGTEPIELVDSIWIKRY